MGVPSTSGGGRIAARGRGSTVKVLGQACGYLQEGSGFVVAPGLVVTNAHVVAGERRTQVVGGQRQRTRPRRCSSTPSSTWPCSGPRRPLGPPLTVDPDDVGRGTQGAVVGYPENGPLTVGPAGVAADLAAEGRDIYDQGTVVRNGLRDRRRRPARATPAARWSAADGQVIGVVFSRSTVRPDVGYALASPGVLARVRRGRARGRTPVGTGACTEG